MRIKITIFEVDYAHIRVRVIKIKIFEQNRFKKPIVFVLLGIIIICNEINAKFIASFHTTHFIA